MKAGSLVSGLASLGAEPTVFPIIAVRALDDLRALDAALDSLQEYAWIIFTSAYGVHHVLGRMAERGMAGERLSQRQVCAVGPGTAAALEAGGIAVTLMPRAFVAEGIVAALKERHGGLERISGLRILLPRAQAARDVLPDALAAAGAHVDLVACYQNLLPDISPEAIRAVMANPPDLLVFTSSSTVTNFVRVLGESAPQVLARATAAALGPITARTLTAYGKSAEILPGASTIPSLLDAIRIWYQTHGGSRSGTKEPAPAPYTERH
jgi:uroporphyrinogen III methyltransferase/synthase